MYGKLSLEVCFTLLSLEELILAYDDYNQWISFIIQIENIQRASKSLQAPRHDEIWANDGSMIDLDRSEIKVSGDWHCVILHSAERAKMDAAHTLGAL